VSKILLGFDGSDGSLKAVDRTCDLAKEGDEVILLYVHPSLPGEDFGDLSPHPTQKETWEALRTAVERLRSKGIDASGVFRRGDIVEQIIGVARDLECDLIVVGSSGTGKIESFMLGSVAEKIAKKAPKPVLIVK